MHTLIKEILEKGFSLNMKLNKEKNRVEYELDGFYKCGSVRLVEKDENTLIAFDRYNKPEEINNFADLVYLNKYWWDASKEKYESVLAPDTKWIPFLLEQGLVKEDINIVKRFI